MTVVYGNNGHNGNGKSANDVSSTSPVAELDTSGALSDFTPLGLANPNPVVQGIIEAFEENGIYAAVAAFEAMKRTDATLATLAPSDDPNPPAEWKLYTLETALQPRPPLEYVVDKVLPYPSLSMFFAPPASYKSMVLMDMAISVATGTPFLPDKTGNGGYATKQVPTLWIDNDNGKRRCDERFGAMAKARGLSLGGSLASIPFHYAPVPNPALNLNDDKSVALLSRTVVEFGIKFLVIDNLGTVSGGVDENSTQMVRVMGNLRMLVEEHELTCVLIHHARKQSSNSNRIGDAIRGSSSIEAALDYGFRVDSRGKNEIMITVAKARGQQIAPVGGYFDHTNRPDDELEEARFYGTAVVDKRNPSSSEPEILALVQEHPSINRGALTKSVKEKLGIGIRRAEKLVDSMVAKGLLVTLKGEHYNAILYKLPGEDSDSQQAEEEKQN